MGAKTPLLEGAYKDDKMVFTNDASVFCMPLIVFGERLGRITWRPTDADTPFDDNHCAFLTGMTLAAGFKTALKVERIENENTRLRLAAAHCRVYQNSLLPVHAQIIPPWFGNFSLRLVASVGRCAAESKRWMR